LSSNVSVRAEYLYVSLGSSAVDVVAQSPFTQPNAASFTAAFSRAAINTVRGGVNWRFN
jgi:opacity protein-like surface antigen